MKNTCEELHQCTANLQRISFPFDFNSIPPNGIYVLFERGEFGHRTDRIVRFGTHKGNNRLGLRLLEHFVTENKDRSIVRKNIGRALLNQQKDDFLEYWELDLTPKAARDKYLAIIDLKKQKQVEELVSQYITGNFSFSVFIVLDCEERIRLEKLLIATVSLCEECKPSSRWLGLSSTKPQISASGLWNVQHLYKQPLARGDMKKIKGLYI